MAAPIPSRAGSRKQGRYHLERAGKKKDKESTGAKEADKKIEGGVDRKKERD